MDAATAVLNAFRRNRAKNPTAVAYVRGATTVAMVALVGRTVFASNVEGAARIEFGEVDLLVEAADLLTLNEPERGDRVVMTLGGSSMTFELMHRPGEPAWRPSNPYRNVLRLHLKRVR